jgi:hypothetical protein
MKRNGGTSEATVGAGSIQRTTGNERHEPRNLLQLGEAWPSRTK